MHKREVHDRATNVFKVEDKFCTLTGVKVWPDGLGERETDGLIGTMEATGIHQTTVPLSLLPKSQIYSVRVRSLLLAGNDETYPFGVFCYAELSLPCRCFYGRFRGG